MKRIFFLFIFSFNILLAVDVGVLFSTTCSICHGTKAETSALGVSRIINTLDEVTIKSLLTSYKNNSLNQYGLGSTMQAQLINISSSDIENLSRYISSLSDTATKTKIAKLYVATFNRAPDTDGLNYWLNSSGLSLSQIAQSFFDQSETQALYPDGTSSELFVNSVYLNLFNRNSETAGLEYWKEELDTQRFSRNLFILAVINGAQDSIEGNDLTILSNKTEVGIHFADAGLNDVTQATNFMKTVTADVSSVTSTKTSIDNEVGQ